MEEDMYSVLALLFILLMPLVLAVVLAFYEMQNTTGKI
jgi:hypothetical protein